MLKNFPYYLVYMMCILLFSGLYGFRMISNYQEEPFPLLPQKDKMEPIKQVTTDSIQYELWLAYDAEERPVSYYAEIFTPVCYSEKCYPVYINFYWDLLGNYIKYDLPPNEILTKLDHVEFDSDDYLKLQEILENESSILKDYKAEELVVSTESELPGGVDAVTGATSKTIQNEVIYGAVYSCFTLWHIAHGDISAEIKEYTEGIQSSELIVHFLQSKNHHYQYYAIKKVMDNGDYTQEKYATPLLAILRGNNIFIADYLLEELPDQVFHDEEEQLWLWETYQMSPYRLQLAILDKLNSLKISKKLHQPLTEQLFQSNQDQKKKIFALLKNQDQLSKPAQHSLLAFLKEEKWGNEAFQILSTQRKLDKQIKVELDQFEK